MRKVKVIEPVEVLEPIEVEHEPMLVCRVDEKRPFVMPVRHYGGDAGFDLASAISVSVAPGTFARIPTNIRVALPPGTWAMIIGRSSTFYKRNLIVNPGIIDNGWTGEIFGVVYNPTARKSYVGVGDRLIQMIVFNLVTPDLLMVDTLPERDRGEKGFGSTGGM